MAKGTPLKERKAGERKYKDVDKTGNPKRKPLSPSAYYGYVMHAGPQHIPASEIGQNMTDALWEQEMTRDTFGDNAKGAASSKRVSDRLKNVMASGGSKGRPHDEHDRDGGGSTFPPRSHADGPAARYGHTAGGKGDRLFDVMNDYGPDWDPTHDDANEYLDHQWPWENETTRGPASSKAVAGKLKNVATTKKAPAEKKRPPIPPYKPAGSSSNKIPARRRLKLPATGSASYGNLVR